MFDLRGTERLIAWKSFRDRLEIDFDPYQSVSDFWSKAPFVHSFLSPDDPSLWPDPWHLILDNKYDDLAIVLGMLYTFKLTDRFSKTNLEIYKSIELKEKKKTPVFFLVVDNRVLNLEYNSVLSVSRLDTVEATKIYAVSPLK